MSISGSIHKKITNICVKRIFRDADKIGAHVRRERGMNMNDPFCLTPCFICTLSEQQRINNGNHYTNPFMLSSLDSIRMQNWCKSLTLNLKNRLCLVARIQKIAPKVAATYLKSYTRLSLIPACTDADQVDGVGTTRYGCD